MAKRFVAGLGLIGLVAARGVEPVETPSQLSMSESAADGREVVSFPIQLKAARERRLPADWQAGAQAPYLLIKLSAIAEPYVAPMSIDTSILHGDDRSDTGSSAVQLRSHSWHQGLFLPDLSHLPRGHSVEWAEFHAHVQWVEREGPASMRFYRMLKPWNENASWTDNGLDSQLVLWDGLRKSVDYSDDPFSRWSSGGNALLAGPLIVPGFGSMVASWLDGSEANFGFLAQLSGEATQVNLSSSETRRERSEDWILSGGGEPIELEFEVDPDALWRICPSSKDLREAWLVLAARNSGGNPMPIASVEVEGKRMAWSFSQGALTVTGLSELLRDRLADADETAAFHLTVRARPGLAIAGAAADEANRPRLSVGLPEKERHSLFDHAIKPRSGVYTTVENGHLSYGGERLRLWGTLGRGDADRLRKMGFNAWRLWPMGVGGYDSRFGGAGKLPAIVPGDGSEMDTLDRAVADMKESGIFIMATQLMGMVPVHALLADDSFVSQGEDWEQWKGAIAASEVSNGPRLFAFVDERLLEARLAHIENVLNHVNPYTNRRYAEEEAIAIWELNNEFGFVPRLLEGDYQSWPEYFRSKLRQRWNAWVLERYRSEGELLQAWDALSDGETWGAVRLGPSFAQRQGFSEQRASDFVRFVIELADRHYQTLRTHARAQAPEGVGVAVAPFSFDTQYRHSIPWLYSQSRSDVASFGNYFWTMGSELGERPSASVMDSLTVHGKPTIIYETNRARPSPFRAEYPHKLAALASWQDWDAVFFHYWQGDKASDLSYLLADMPYPTIEHYWSAVHHQSDPVMTSAMAIAGRFFLQNRLPAGPQPVRYHFGPDSIFSYEFASGPSVGNAAFEQGARIVFDDVAGEHWSEGRNPQPGTGQVRSGEAVLWDWENERLVIDTPTAKAYVGPLHGGSWRWSDGFELTSPAPWIAFAMVRSGPQPDGGQRWLVSSVADAYNKGFAMEKTDSSDPTAQAKAILERGRWPVVVEPIEFRLSFPGSGRLTVKAYDFALRLIDTSAPVSGFLDTQEGESETKPKAPIWIRELIWEESP
ncbi:beta-galactosidase [Pelagicoccus sp. SDUM812003]|uniref:beta-galactosidase n=1 Tax=Pelagicoccus sp. SDUM812003 TaxID=3041267 RepID=UPI0028101FC1|nr:beta-galactosidase [Pelagicoccus sp. SDUM812003]MDQ8204651.1 beta-galactosidase [Pelagicoccus sp. SDUM812003]